MDSENFCFRDQPVNSELPNQNEFYDWWVERMLRNWEISIITSPMHERLSIYGRADMLTVGQDQQLKQWGEVWSA